MIEKIQLLTILGEEYNLFLLQKLNKKVALKCVLAFKHKFNFYDSEGGKLRHGSFPEVVECLHIRLAQED